MIQIEPHELRILLADAMQIAIANDRVTNGNERPFLTEAEAWRKYKRVNVERWVKEKLIKPAQDGPNAMKRFDKVELLILSKTSNRSTYLTTKERKEVNLLNQALERHNITDK